LSKTNRIIILLVIDTIFFFLELITVNGVFLVALYMSIFLQNPKLIYIVDYFGLLLNILSLALFHDYSYDHGHAYDKDIKSGHTNHEYSVMKEKMVTTFLRQKLWDTSHIPKWC
ncbi:hypothetical protein N7451_002776, partial [Penicillium sp. IBT 35674x]